MLIPRILLVICLAVATGACGQAREAPGAKQALDRYPGFGQSERSALRDDAIAFWEAYRKEVLTSRCMEVKHGYLYWPETSFHWGYAARFTRYLGVAPDDEAKLRGRDLNTRYVRTLTARLRTRYELALWGEISLDGHTTVGAGAVGELQADFLKGGCKGNADRRLPSVWDTRRLLEDDLEARVRRARSDDQLRAWEVDFIQRHLNALESVRRFYSNVRVRMQEDKDFIEFLQREAAPTVAG